MQIKLHEAEVRVDESLMRVYVAAPKPAGKYPGILLYSEIFQLTGPIIRAANRIAGHGFVVAAPEIYHRHEPIGTVLGYDDIGRIRGNEGGHLTPVAAYDADAKATFDYLSTRPDVAPGELGTMGFCIGGHLSWRAALDPRCRAAVCCYPTGVHSGKLGKDADAGTFARFNDIKGEILAVFGDVDPHVPPPGRESILKQLAAAGVKHKSMLVEGEHAFMRDEGPRYDAELTDKIYAEAIALFRRVFA